MLGLSAQSLGGAREPPRPRDLARVMPGGEHGFPAVAECAIRVEREEDGFAAVPMAALTGELPLPLSGGRVANVTEIRMKGALPAYPARLRPARVLRQAC